MSNNYDLVIVGAGPAGLSAGLYGARLGLRTLIIGETLGGMAAEAALVENYPGIERSSGMEIAERMRRQCESAGAEILLAEKVERLDLTGKRKKAMTHSVIFESDALVLATGCTHKDLGVPGEEEFRGRGVSYCAVCDGVFFKGKRVLVVGGGNTAAMEALYLGQIAGKVFMVHRRSELRADSVLKGRVRDSAVEVLWNRQVKEIQGDNLVNRVVLLDTEKGDEISLEVDGVFIAVGEVPKTAYAKKAGVVTIDAGFIEVNRKQETNIDGVYAAGDMTGGVKQIGVATGEGITAAINAYLYITGGWYGRGKGK